MIDYDAIRKKAEEYAPDIYRFLREIVAIQSFDGEEGSCIQRIKSEMEKVGFDEITVDPMGNLLGKIGHGKHLIAMDGHCDIVSFGDTANWTFDPLEGMENEECIGGRGSTDQKGGIASMVYAGKIIKELALDGDYTLLVTATVQEENCDGLCWKYIIEQDGIKPDFAILTEPSDNCIRNGQRGRIEIGVSTKGVSCHGSMPDKGDNAVYKMAPIISAIRRLHQNMTDDGILGKGSVTISEIYSQSPSRCAVADGCTIALDRRLNSRENTEFALEQIRALPEVKATGADVFLFRFEDSSYTGLKYPTDLFFPSWVIEKDAPPCKATAEACHKLFGKKPEISPWTFSTNGVAIMGLHGIPCVGYGPGRQTEAHSPDEKTWKKDLVNCCAVYAALPLTYLEQQE